MKTISIPAVRPTQIYIGTTENQGLIKIDLLQVLREELIFRERCSTGFVTCQSRINFSVPMRARFHGYCLQI